MVKSHYSYSFTTWNLSNFKLTTCILHHFAFLDWLLTHNFSDPKTHFLPLKSHFLTAILPFLVMYLMLRKGLFIPFALDIYAFRLTFGYILHRVLPQNTLRFAPKRLPFSTKMQCVLHQNALRLAANRSAFSCK